MASNQKIHVEAVLYINLAHLNKCLISLYLSLITCEMGVTSVPVTPWDTKC